MWRDTLEEMKTTPGEWLRGDGPESEVIISTRIRLARNLADTPFVNNLNKAYKAKMFNELREKLVKANVVRNGVFFSMDEVDSIDQQFLVERHLISMNLIQSTPFTGALIGNNDRISIMVNEEDHLRLQVLSSGFEVRETWNTINALDSALETQVNYAFSHRFGYLSACPTNTGTGMREPHASLTRTDHQQAHSESHRRHLQGRPHHPWLLWRGHQGRGPLLSSQQSNHPGHDRPACHRSGVHHPPDQPLRKRSPRRYAQGRNRLKLEDKIWRDIGMLQSARILSSTETLNAFSSVRMGVYMNIIKDLDIKTLNYLLVYSQPAHLQKLTDENLSPDERDAKRATHIREALRHIKLS